MRSALVFIFLLACPLSFAALDYWHWEVLKENNLDVLRVYNATSQSRDPLITVQAEGVDQNFKEAEEIYIKSKKKRYLITRWALGVTGSETIKIYDPFSKKSKEIYKLQTMPTEYRIKDNKVIFYIPFYGKYLKTEWVPKR